MGRGGGGDRVRKAKKSGKFFQFMMKKNFSDYLPSINCINVSIHGCNCCKTDIEVSKCVYLPSMAVKIERTLAGHNHDILQQCLFDVHASRSMGPQQDKKLPKYMVLSIKTYLHTRKIK